MFFILITIVKSSNGYDFKPPLQQTNVSEIGRWTLTESAINLKNVIRLTSNIPGHRGRICHRVPTNFPDWNAEVTVSITDGSGGYLYFFFTDELCPIHFRSFNGFVYIIGPTDKKGYRPVFFANGTFRYLANDLYNKIGAIDTNGHDNEAIKIIVLNRDDQLKFSYKFVNIENKKVENNQNKNKFNEVDDDENGLSRFLTVPNTIKSGYFSILGLNEEEQSSNIDVHSFKLSNNFGSVPNFLDKDFDSVSRKMLLGHKRERFVGKQIRKLKMPTIVRLLNIISNETKVNGTNLMDTKDAMRIIAEMQKRLKATVSVNELSNFIENDIEKAAEIAYKKISMATDNFEETNQNIGELWVGLKTQLIGLVIESVNEMEKMKEDIMKMAKNIKLSQIDKEAVQEVSNEINPSDSIINSFIVVFSLIEIVCYCFFFFIKHQEMKRYGKID